MCAECSKDAEFSVPGGNAVNHRACKEISDHKITKYDEMTDSFQRLKKNKNLKTSMVCNSIFLLAVTFLNKF